MPFNHIKLRRLRELFGFSQTAVAFSLNISQPTYYRLESGSSKLDAEQLEAVTRLYGITVEEMLAHDSTQLLQLVVSRDAFIKHSNGK